MVLLAALVAFFAWHRSCSGFAVERVRSAIEKRVESGWERLLGWATFPKGIRPGDGDPWAEAQRRRAAGDLSGAIVCLFAHQLLTLDQLGLIRLAPGKTGRHYVQRLRDRESRRLSGGDTPPVRGCLLRTEIAHRRARLSRSGNSPRCFQERRRMLGAGASP